MVPSLGFLNIDRYQNDRFTRPMGNCRCKTQFPIYLSSFGQLIYKFNIKSTKQSGNNLKLAFTSIFITFISLEVHFKNLEKAEELAYNNIIIKRVNRFITLDKMVHKVAPIQATKDQFTEKKITFCNQILGLPLGSKIDSNYDNVTKKTGKLHE
ncbi:hypothetical protein ACTFIV_005152 [Dictyostelium citrinum]